MDTANSQKKSPRSSARSEKSTSKISEGPGQSRPGPGYEEEEYLDRSTDLVARVRAAKEAAQRQMESFGDPSEYEVTLIRGRAKEEIREPSQSPLDLTSNDRNGAD